MDYTRNLFDGGGAEWAFDVAGSMSLPAPKPHLLSDCAFRGYTKAAIRIGRGTGSRANPPTVEVRGGSFSGNEFWLDSACHPDAVLRVRGTESFDLRRYDTPGGVYVPEWNARRYDI